MIGIIFVYPDHQLLIYFPDDKSTYGVLGFWGFGVLGHRLKKWRACGIKLDRIPPLGYHPYLVFLQAN